ncbi:predicted protein [Histoplasma capsulatum G186AR]|uniref:Uncharacterized protein n=1 Tax=Ajellomyces capsulatus (strain G186AR / H82 / ATCC MYA-2454 / RMSCC 2432) TaxID=447093 RepID=C0NCY6_AJECG|nr:uncharacterized protein HCBG_00982 [Histoplasma capsulatum G186AR]EEH11527.1 predicted protein [Histoplasma capsulatum G186AR]
MLTIQPHSWLADSKMCKAHDETEHFLEQGVVDHSSNDIARESQNYSTVDHHAQLCMGQWILTSYTGAILRTRKLRLACGTIESGFGAMPQRNTTSPGEV